MNCTRCCNPSTSAARSCHLGKHERSLGLDFQSSRRRLSLLWRVHRPLSMAHAPSATRCRRFRLQCVQPACVAVMANAPTPLSLELLVFVEAHRDSVVLGPQGCLADGQGPLQQLQRLFVVPLGLQMLVRRSATLGCGGPGPPRRWPRSAAAAAVPLCSAPGPPGRASL